MADLTIELRGAVIAACQANAGEASAALGRALDASFALQVEMPLSLQATALPDFLRDQGLVVVLTVGASAAVLLIPAAGGCVPSWCAAPDATGQSKLATLGQELGMLLLGDDVAVDDFRSGVVQSLAESLRRGGVANGAAVVPLRLTAAPEAATAWLVWPATEPSSILVETETSPSATTATSARVAPSASTAAAAPAVAVASPAPSQPAAPGPAGGTPAGVKAKQPAAGRAAPPAPAARPRVTSPEGLPHYTRSLLRIRVPVHVVLAEQRQPLRRIIELGPGSIIQFEKSCEETLELEAGNRRIASGEAVKVGDKFGLRITSIVLPEERFGPVQPGRGQPETKRR